jgi:hypothetical protein
MSTNKKLLAVAAAIVCCVIAVWSSTSIHGSQSTYELRPQIAIPEHKTDITRVVDAYERLMERYLDLTDRNSALMSEDIRNIAASLDSIDARLAELSARTARIERAFGIQQPGSSAEALNRTEIPPPNRQAK